MKVQLAHILQSLFHTTELDEVPVHRLQETLREHPYFNAAHFLLAQKLRHQDPEQYDVQVQKAAIYFYDPLWMHWQLNQQELAVSPPVGVRPEVVAMTESPMMEVEREAEDDEFVAVIENGRPDEDLGANESGTIISDPIESGINDSYVDESDSIVSDPIESEISDFHIKVSDSVVSDPIESTIHEPETPQSETNESVPAETAPALQAEEHPVAATDRTNGQETPKPTETPEKEKQPPAFDPYYTIDYFAYQGIKAPTDLQPGDKLGRQLKSFTEWLKTMKRLPQAVREGQTDENEQQNIQRFAAGSLEKKEVVTETMAEVLVKQDKKEEAIVIYEKLSLLDPSKSAYFAAKIENLKSELI